MSTTFSIRKLEKPAPAALFHPANLFNLFFRPARFFTAALNEAPAWALVLAIYIYGLTQAVIMVRNKLIETGEVIYAPFRFWIIFEVEIESWPSFWIEILLFGIARGVFALVVGGMWFSARIQLSDGSNHSSTLARRVFILSTLVASLPPLVLTIVLAAVYPNFLSAYRDSWILIDLVIYVPWIWSLIVALRAVWANFDVGKWKAIFWFLPVPIALDLFLSYFL